MVEVGRSRFYKPKLLIVLPVFAFFTVLTFLLVPLSLTEVSAYGSLTHAQTTILIWDEIKGDLENAGLNLGDPQGSREEIVTYYRLRNAFVYGANAPDAAYVPSKFLNTPEASSQLDALFSELNERRVGGHDVDMSLSEITSWPISSHSLDFAINYLLKSAWEMSPSDERTEKICFTLGYIAHILQDKQSSNVIIGLDDVTAVGDLGLEEPRGGVWGGEVIPLSQLESLIDFFPCVNAPIGSVIISGANISFNEYGVLEWISWPGERRIIASEHYVVVFDLPEFLSTQMQDYLNDHPEIPGGVPTKTGLLNTYHLWTTYLDLTSILKGELYDPMYKFLQKHFGTTKFTFTEDMPTPILNSGTVWLEDDNFKIEVDTADWLPFGLGDRNIRAELGESEFKEAVKNFLEAYRDYLNRETLPSTVSPGEWHGYEYIQTIMEEDFYPYGIDIRVTNAKNYFSVGDYVILEYYDPILDQWRTDECCSTIVGMDPDADSMALHVAYEFGHYYNTYTNKIKRAGPGECVPPGWKLINIDLNLPHLPGQQLQVYANFWNKSVLCSLGRCGSFFNEIDIPEAFFEVIDGLFPLIGINSYIPNYDLDHWYTDSIEYEYAKRADLTDPNGQWYGDFWTLEEGGLSAQGVKAFGKTILEDIINNGITGAMNRNKWLDDEYWTIGAESLRRAAVMKSLLKEGCDSQYLDRKIFAPRWMQIYDIKYLRGTERLYEIPDASNDQIKVQVELFSPLWTTEPVDFDLGLRVKADDPQNSYQSDEIVAEDHYAVNWQDFSMYNLIKYNQGNRMVFETSFTPSTSYYGYHVELTWDGKVFFTTDLEPFIHNGIEEARIGSVQGKREKMDKLYSTYVPYNAPDYPGGKILKSLRYTKEVAYDRNASISDVFYAVESAGFYDGAYTKFAVGTSLYSGPDYAARGIHVVAEKPSGLIEHRVFDTHRNACAAEGFYGYLSDLDVGTTVLLGISGDAIEKIPEGITDGITALLDSSEFTKVEFRDSWAYIGEKQSDKYSCWAERRVRQREGVAATQESRSPIEIKREYWWIILIILVILLVAIILNKKALESSQVE